MARSATLCIALALAWAGCSESPGSSSVDGGGAVSQGEDAGQEPEEAAVPDCIDDPRTHDEIINACTDAEKIEKRPDLPLLLADGGLPPLP